jgi:ABC-type transport system involved in multi-copper enzyme maturation permease subunit
MTSIEETPVDAAAVEIVEVLSDTRWERFEAWLGRQSDRLNPILVKEARQALRSRQFTTTFFLMLAAGWTWSIMGLALLGPAAYYNATGPDMFFVYYMILTAPLIIVIPYFAYNSLASERHDRTYELVSITALDATKILVGKLCGIGMQMIVYLSALFPCLAFTYLLRGLDIFTVMLAVGYTCLLALGLAMLGLMLATLSPPRQRHIVQGVLFAIALCFTFFVIVAFISELIGSEGVYLEDSEFWQLNLGLAIVYVNAFALVFLSARSLLMSPAQNRSTALRVALATAQLSAVGWFGWAALRWNTNIIFALILLSTIVWFVAGLIMVGESSVLSPRVKRGLPQSSLGRALLTWFTPGPGTGYMFMISNMLMLTAMATVIVSPAVVELGRAAGGSVPTTASLRNSPGEIIEASIVATSYLAIYLGLSKLILSTVRRYDEVRLTIRFLVPVLLLMVGGGGPWILQITYPPTRNLDYTLMQTTNPMWTLWEYCIDNGIPAGLGDWLVTVLPLSALVIWGLNLPGIARELMQTRAAKPARVAEEDAELAAQSAQPVGPTSPWDE